MNLYEEAQTRINLIDDDANVNLFPIIKDQII